MNKPTVMIADDHQIMADGLRRLLESEFDVVAVVADGLAMIATARKLEPDAIVTDIAMPSLNGIEAAIQLHELGVKSRIVFLTMQRDVAYARRAMDAGAAGFVLKHSAASELVVALREALQGRTYITPAITGDLLQAYRFGDSHRADGPHSGIHSLTSRQREVLQLVAEGKSAKEVAALLNISSRTAEVHKARVLEVLGLRNTAELVQFAIRNGIISI